MSEHGLNQQPPDKLEQRGGQVVVGGKGGSSGDLGAGLGSVDRTPCCDYDKWPLMVSSAWGQYLAALAWVSQGQVE